MSRRIHRKIPSPAPIAAAIEVARSGKKFRLPHNPRVTSITHDIIKYQEKHRALQEQLLTQFQFLLSSGIAIPSNLLLSLQEQLSYNFSYTPANVLTTEHSASASTNSNRFSYQQQQQQQLQQRLFNFAFASIDDISSQIYHQQQLINSIHQLTCHPNAPCQFDAYNPTVCLYGDLLHGSVGGKGSHLLPSSASALVSNSSNKRGLPEPKCQCSLKSSPMHQLHQQQQQHQQQQHHESASSTVDGSIKCKENVSTSSKGTTMSVQETSVTCSITTAATATTTSSTVSAMKPALSNKSRTVNPPNSIMPLNSSSNLMNDHQHQHHQHQHHHESEHTSGNRINSLLPCTLQKVVKFNLNPSYSKGGGGGGRASSTTDYDNDSRLSQLNRTNFRNTSPSLTSSALHHQNSLCKSLTSAAAAHIANRNRSRNFARTQSWERVASIVSCTFLFSLYFTKYSSQSATSLSLSLFHLLHRRIVYFSSSLASLSIALHTSPS